jgi:phosphoglycerate dehydrogenase-like enzyme
MRHASCKIRLHSLHSHAECPCQPSNKGVPENGASQGANVDAALIYMPEENFDLHFPAGRLGELRRLCRLIGPVPCTSLGRAQAPGEVGIIFTGWGTPRLEAEVLEAMPKLRLVAHTAGTVKGIVSPALLEGGVRVTHAAVANAKPVAEYVLGVILLANKAFLTFAEAYRTDRDRFRRSQHPVASSVGNRGRVVGLIGASRVGRLTLQYLRRHDFELLLADPFVSDSEARELGARLVSTAELFCSADIVSLHQPLLPETRHSIGRTELASMRDGALLINTARGAIIDHDALAVELASGRIRAVLDVTEPEPLPASSPLWDMPNVVITPHIAGSMGNEIERMTELTLQEVERFIHGLPLQHEVSLADWSRVA